MDPSRVVIDTERVIAEVRERPAIWNVSHELYKNREARSQAWTDASRAVVPYLLELNRVDQREIEKKIQQRWRTARDCFVKARAHMLGAGGAAAGGRGGGERSYGYYEAMTFLEPTLRLPLKVQKTIASPSPSPSPTPTARSSKRVPSAPAAGRKRAKLDNGASTATATAIPDADQPEPELSPLERKLVTLMSRRESPLAEDDDNFFKSLAPMLRAFDTQQKLVFRSRVLALALEVQSGTVAEGHYVTMKGEGDEEEGEEEELSISECEEDALETKYRPPPSPHQMHSD